jgi:hypothetical protein
MTNLSEKLSYCDTTVLDRICTDLANPYYKVLSELANKQRQNKKVADSEYKKLPCCGLANYWSAANGYYSVNFHYNFFHTDYIDKKDLLEKFLSFLSVVDFTECRDSEAINWKSSFSYFINSWQDEMSEEDKIKSEFIINILQAIDPIANNTEKALDTINRDICPKLYDNALCYFKLKDRVKNLYIPLLPKDYYIEKYSKAGSLKAKEVMNILSISRQTLSNYVKQGLVKIDTTINGKYRYNKESVFNLLEGDN